MKLNAYGSKNQNFRNDMKRNDNVLSGLSYIPNSEIKNANKLYLNRQTGKVYFVWASDGTLGEVVNIGTLRDLQPIIDSMMGRR